MRRHHFPAALLLILLIAPLMLTVPGCDELITEVNEITLFDSTLGQECVVCHTDNNDANIIVPRGQWENSAHANTTTLEATVTINGETFNTAQTECARCHSGNGYVAFIETGTPALQERPSVINCYTCHVVHSGQFGSWRLDSLRGGDTVMIADTGGQMAIYAQGTSNQCAQCHQAVEVPVFFEPTDSLEALWGPHFAPQAQMVLGVGGYRFGTSQIIPTHQAAVNRDGCNSCHFGANGGQGIGYRLGEHTFRLQNETDGQLVTTCNEAGCHASAPITDWVNLPVSDTLDQLADSLETLLVQLGALDPADTSGRTIRVGEVLSRGAAQMLHNYLLYRFDNSRGIHNTDYARALLQESVAQFDSLPFAEFMADVTLICAGATVTFTNQSTGAIDSVRWQFGEANAESTELNPTYTYDTAGVYTVQLTIFSPGGVDIERKFNYVRAEATAPGFIASDAVICTGASVNFTDVTSGPNIVSWTWRLDDTLIFSTAQNPSLTFNDTGTYSITLITTGDCGTDSLTRTDVLQVIDEIPQASFVDLIDTVGPAPQTVTTSNNTPNLTSGAAIDFLWDFGDPSTTDDTSSLRNGTYTYAIPGTYVITLTASSGCGSTQASDTIVVTLPGGSPAKASLWERVFGTTANDQDR